MRTIVFCGPLFTTLSFISHPVAAADIKITWETCVENSTIVTQKASCYVIDQKTREKRFTLKICAGVNVNVGTIVWGSAAETLLCATVTLKAKNEKDARNMAEEALKRELMKSVQIKKATAKFGKEVKSIGRFTIRVPDQKTKKRLWDEVRKLNTNPFPD